MTTAPETALRTGVIALLENDAGVKATAMGATPRIGNRVDPNWSKPYAVIEHDVRGYATNGQGAPPIDTEQDLRIYLEGDFEGDEEGEAILLAFRVALEAWAVTRPALSGHRLANLEFIFSKVGSAEDGKSYAGRQDWRAVTDQES